MEKNLLKYNVLTSLLLQFATIVSGFVAPKIILSFFGSNTNGLLSSITQFLSYVTILEGGIGSVIMSVLYKPLHENDTVRVSKIINSTKKFFSKLSLIYFFYVTVFTFIYPALVKTGYSYIDSVILIVVMAVNLFFQYFLSISYKILLNADRKVFFVSLVQTLVIIINLVAIVVCAQIFNNIILIKVFSAIVFLIQPIAFTIYVKKKYRIIKSDGYDEYTEKHRWDGLGINTAYFIHSNTDIIVLTIWASLSDVSIYAVYMLVVKALKSIVISISTAIIPSFGKSLASDNLDDINRKFKNYEFVISFATTLLFTCGIVLITPFVDVYTQSITDVNYHNVLFGILIVISEMIYCYRDPYVSATYAAGRIKEMSQYAYIEAGLNIVTSIILVRFFGLVGVAVGTIVGMAYRAIVQVIYLKDNVLHRSPSIFAKNTIVFAACSLICCLICFTLLNLNVSSYLGWIIIGFETFGIVLLCCLLFSLVFYRKEFFFLIRKMFLIKPRK